jgi:hypothetical protein
MMQPSAISASYSSFSARACKATGTSSAPGTRTWSMCLLLTPSASSSARQAWARASVMLSLKRACTMPIFSFVPSMRSAFPLSAPNMSYSFGM